MMDAQQPLAGLPPQVVFAAVGVRVSAILQELTAILGDGGLAKLVVELGYKQPVGRAGLVVQAVEQTHDAILGTPVTTGTECYDFSDARDDTGDLKGRLASLAADHVGHEKGPEQDMAAGCYGIKKVSAGGAEQEDVHPATSLVPDLLWWKSDRIVTSSNLASRMNDVDDL